MTKNPLTVPFASRLKPAVRQAAFEDDGWWTWCGSAVFDTQGRTHLFASRWPKSLPFFNGYLAQSRIVQAVADDPLGPFRYWRDVLPPTNDARWDARMTHNPAVIAFDGRYWLFYIGLSYDLPLPDLGEPFEAFRPIIRRLRIGLAVGNSLDGEFHRLDAPVINTDVAPWPHFLTTNPSPVVTPEGRIRVYYRTPRLMGEKVRNVLAVAEADYPTGPYRPLLDRPLLENDHHLEDPYVWWNGRSYEALAKDLDGNTAGQRGAAVHMHSPDGLHWQIADPPTAFRRELRFAEGNSLEVGNLERPSLLLDAAGEPCVLYAAASDHPQGFHNASRTWVQAIPLKSLP
jgi:hypothetical protein